MSEDNLQKHLDHSMYGKALLKPEEQRKFLGTFRERCYVTMTVAQMKNAENKANFFKEIEKHSSAFVLLNGSIDSGLQSTYIKELNSKEIDFTIVNDNVSSSTDSIGLVLADKQAVDNEIIDIEEKYPKAEKKEEQKKKSFWRLF